VEKGIYSCENVIAKESKEWTSHLAIKLKNGKHRAKGIVKGNPKVDTIEMSQYNLR
jgi:hypothetical protein